MSGDVDFFAVAALEGQTITAEVGDGGSGECLGLALDSELAILDVDGTTQLAFNDEISNSSNFCSRTSFVVTADGTYFVRVRESAAFAFGDTFAYQLFVKVE